jgi:hypothetical protein
LKFLYLELYITAYTAGEARTFNAEDGFSGGIKDLVRWFDDAPRLLHVSNDVARWSLHFDFFQAAREPTRVAAQGRRKVNDLTASGVHHLDFKGTLLAANVSRATIGV